MSLVWSSSFVPAATHHILLYNNNHLRFLSIKSTFVTHIPTSITTSTSTSTYLHECWSVIVSTPRNSCVGILNKFKRGGKEKNNWKKKRGELKRETNTKKKRTNLNSSRYWHGYNYAFGMSTVNIHWYIYVQPSVFRHKIESIFMAFDIFIWDNKYIRYVPMNDAMRYLLHGELIYDWSYKEISCRLHYKYVRTLKFQNYSHHSFQIRLIQKNLKIVRKRWTK